MANQANILEVILKAVLENDMDKLKDLLNNSVNSFDINEKISNDHPTVLHAAIKKGNPEIVEYLLKHGGKIEFKNDDEGSLLHNVIQSKDEETSMKMAKIFINQGVGINSRNKQNGMTALHLALQNKYLKLFRFLIESGALIHLKNNNGETPLFIAVNNNLYNEARILIDKGSAINDCNDQQTHITEVAISWENEEMLSLLLDNGADANDLTGLLIAASLGLVNIMKVLLAHGAIKDLKDFTGSLIFNEAIKYQNIDMIEFLIDVGADINNDLENTTPLGHMLTVSGSHQSHIINILLKQIALLKAQNLYVHEMNLKLIQSTPWVLDKYNSYYNELVKMKETKICNTTSVTYFDILTKHHHFVVSYLRCKQVNTSLKSKEHDKYFSLYNNKLEANYLLALKRLKMMCELQMILEEVLGSVLLQDLIIKIIEYFSDQDLEISIKK